MQTERRQIERWTEKPHVTLFSLSRSPSSSYPDCRQFLLPRAEEQVPIIHSSILALMKAELGRGEKTSYYYIRRDLGITSFTPINASSVRGVE